MQQLYHSIPVGPGEQQGGEGRQMVSAVDWDFCESMSFRN